LHFYLGLKNEPWLGPAGSENACLFWRVATQLKGLSCNFRSFLTIPLPPQLR